MKKKLIIIGTGFNSEHLSNCIDGDLFLKIKKNSIKEYITFNKKQKKFLNKPCRYFYDIKNFDKKADYFNSISDAFFRKEVTSSLVKQNLNIINLISKSAIINKVNLGYGNLIFLNTSIHHDSDIGNSNFFYNYVHIAHHNKIGSYNNFFNFSSTSGNVKCNDLNNFFEYSSVHPNKKLGSKCIILERATVTKNMKDYEIKKTK